MPDGTLIRPEKGTPQDSVVSPDLANLFLHWAFDRWMAEHDSDIPFERYNASISKAVSSRGSCFKPKNVACQLSIAPSPNRV